MIRVLVLALCVVWLSGCELQPTSANETLSSVDGALRAPVEKGECPDGSFAGSILNPLSAEYRALSSGVEQIAILSEFRKSYHAGVRADDPMLAPFYDAMDWSEAMIGPFTLEIIDGVDRVIDRNGIPVVMPFDSGVENETDFVARHTAIAAFLAAERLGVRSSDPRLSELYSILSSERDSGEVYVLRLLEGTTVQQPAKCN